MTAFAVNLFDCMYHEREVPTGLLIRPHLTGQYVEAEATLDGIAGILDCPEEQIRAIIHVIRRKYPKNKWRFYESKTGKGGWKRI